MSIRFRCAILAICLTGLIAALTAQPKLILPNETIDLGEIYNGEIVKSRIVLKSVGSMPLKVHRITTSCGCTTVRDPKGEIPPGKSDIVEVDFNSAGFRGKAVKYVHIETNDPDNPYASVTLTAVIREELEPTQGYSLLWFGDALVGKKVEQQYALRNVSSAPITIKGIASANKAISVEYDKKSVAPRDSVTLTVAIVPEKTGYFYETFFVETTSKNQSRVPVRVSLVGVQAK